MKYDQKQIEEMVQGMIQTWSHYRSRWAQIVLWGDEDLRELQEWEKSQEKRYGRSQTRGLVGMMDKINTRNGMTHFWDRTVDEAERAQRLAAFYASIFTTWASIVRKNIEVELNDENSGQAADKSKDFDELTVLHRCDWSVKSLGERPNLTPIKNYTRQNVVRESRQVYEP